MEINLTLSILAAACGGFLLGWQLRTDLRERRSRREAHPSGDVTAGDAHASPPGPALHTPSWEQPVPERVN